METTFDIMPTMAQRRNYNLDEFAEDATIVVEEQTTKEKRPFLDRAYNATELATGICSALHGDEKYQWFLS